MGISYVPASALDSDLTAIAALSTTAYGRALLALADASAGRTALGLGTAATQASAAFDSAGAAAAAQAASNPLRGAIATLPRSGRYVTPPHTSATAATLTLNRCYYLPFRLAATRTFDRLAVDVTTNVASAVLRVGIYADDATFNWPGSLLLDAGTLDAATAIALVEATISQQLTAGLWWLAVACQGAAPAVRSSATFVDRPSTAAAGTATIVTSLTQSGVSGALPPTAAPAGELATSPIMWLRAA